MQLELLSLLVEDYETRNIPEPPPSPTTVVDFMPRACGTKHLASLTMSYERISHHQNRRALA